MTMSQAEAVRLMEMIDACEYEQAYEIAASIDPLCQAVLAEITRIDNLLGDPVELEKRTYTGRALLRFRSEEFDEGLEEMIRSVAEGDTEEEQRSTVAAVGALLLLDR